MVNIYLAVSICACLLLSKRTVQSLQNGLARTPPMGWLSWERFGCNTDCREDPDNCIGERLLMQMADAMVTEGYKEAGYEYITVDDCWLAHKRDQHGLLQPDPIRFPRGMKALADYIHKKGLKLGVYEDVGTKTCAGFPGTDGHQQVDAHTFADWGVDMLKYDGCNADVQRYVQGYPAMAHFLNQTGRHILYSCEWPLYARSQGTKPNYKEVAQYCNTWRVYGDIYDSWDSITHIVNYYADNDGDFQQVAGPGQWNDADMITLGNYGLSHDQERVQMGMWAMMASPLLMSVDLRSVRPSSKSLLQNKRIIAVNQDKLGVQGKLILKIGDSVQIWSRPIKSKGSFAIAILYMQSGGAPKRVSVKFSDIGLTSSHGYNVTELFDGSHIGFYKPDVAFVCHINPTGIFMVQALVMP